MSEILKVLFLDDEELICECFSDLFNNAQTEVVTFCDPQKAIEFSHKNKMDIIFLDFRMPGIKGDQVALKMPQDVPIYMISGDYDPMPVYEFKDILPKPFDPKKITAIFDKYRKTEN